MKKILISMSMICTMPVFGFFDTTAPKSEAAYSEGASSAYSSPCYKWCKNGKKIPNDYICATKSGKDRDKCIDTMKKELPPCLKDCDKRFESEKIAAQKKKEQEQKNRNAAERQAGQSHRISAY